MESLPFRRGVILRQNNGSSYDSADRTNIFHGSMYLSIYPVNNNLRHFFFVVASMCFVILFVCGTRALRVPRTSGSNAT